MMGAKPAVNDVRKGLAFRDTLDEWSTDLRDEGGENKRVAAWGGWDEARVAIEKARLAVEGGDLSGRKRTERKEKERASPMERVAYEEEERADEETTATKRDMPGSSAELENTPTHEDTPISSTGNDEGQDSLLSRPNYRSPVFHPDPPSNSHAIPTNILEREAILPTNSIGSPSARNENENENDNERNLQAWDGWGEATAAIEKANSLGRLHNGADSQLKGADSQLKGEDSWLVGDEKSSGSERKHEGEAPVEEDYPPSIASVPKEDSASVEEDSETRTPELRDPHVRTQTPAHPNPPRGGSLEKERAYSAPSKSSYYVPSSSSAQKEESVRDQSKHDWEQPRGWISKEEGEVSDKSGVPSGWVAKQEEEISKVAGPPQDLLGDVMAKQGVPADPKLEKAPEEEEEEESWYEMVSEFLADATLHKPARVDERKEVVPQPEKSVWQWMDEAGLWCTWGALVGYRGH